MEIISENMMFGGRQLTISHESQSTGTTMRAAVFLPPHDGPRPVVLFLSGLTCTEDNFTQKAGAQQMAAALGLILVAPDTSPRGDGVADDEGYDLGQGAGFYVDATQPPWAPHFSMYSYVSSELPALIDDAFPTDPERWAISGHSMGGHGALVCALSNPGRYRSVSAFAPIVAPSRVPWGEKAFSTYLGDDRESWKRYDACELVRGATERLPLLIDQGDEDSFLEEQLRPDLLVDACKEAGHPIELRMQPGYDHSYYFIASFVRDHLHHHAKALTD